MADRNDIYLRQGLADNGGVYIHTDQVATGPFCAIVSAGSKVYGDITGATVAAAVSNIKTSAGAEISNLVLPTGFVLTGWFQSVTAGPNAEDILICMYPPKDTQ